MKLTTANVAQSVGIKYTPKLVVVPRATPVTQADRIRPGTLLAMIGQEEVRTQLSTMLISAQRRGVPPEHSLFGGSAGLGKTTLARIISTFMGTDLVETTALALISPKLLAIELSRLNPGDVFFVDEIHSMTKKVTEALYRVMEEGKIDIQSGSGATLRTITVDIAPFTLVGATTSPGTILGPLRDRFGFTAQLEFYSDADMTTIIHTAASHLDIPVTFTPEAAFTLGSRSRATPRVAITLLRKVRDVATTMQEPNEDGEFPPLVIDTDMVESTLELFHIDSLGLNQTDQTILTSLCVKHMGGPVGIMNLQATSGEDKRTITDQIEPFLIRQGLMTRQTTGRVATKKAYDHLGLQCPPDISWRT